MSKSILCCEASDRQTNFPHIQHVKSTLFNEKGKKGWLDIDIDI